MSTHFTVDRENLRDTHWLERESATLAPGRIRVRIDHFALTSNNITYAAFGDRMRYWDFFRAAKSVWDACPCGDSAA